jgi:hypothetical protein
MPDENEEEILETTQEIVKMLQLMVKNGYSTEDEMVEAAIDDFECEFDQGNWEERARAMARTVMNAHMEEQKKWPAVTDCDKLDAAFDQLSKKDVLARHNYWCCSNCATTAIDDEVNEHIVNFGQRIKGFVYYHSQDTDLATENGALYLGYGSSCRTNAETIAVGKMIVDALNAQNLNTTWKGTAKDRIIVNVNWKRRRQPKPRVMFPFLKKQSDTNSSAAKEHYASKPLASTLEASKLTNEEIISLGDWPAFAMRHLTESDPSQIEIDYAKRDLMKQVLNLKAIFYETKKRPATSTELASQLKVHPIMIESVNQVLRFHLNEL